MTAILPSSENVRPARAGIVLVTRDPGTVARVRAALVDELDVFLLGDGQDATNLVDEHHPSLALVDMTSAPEWGLATCERLRACSRGKRLPVLVLARADDLPSIREAYGLGALDFVTPELGGPALRERLRFVLRAARAMVDAHESGLRLARVQRIAHLGSWVRNLDSGELWADAEVLRMLRLGTVDEHAAGLMEQMVSRVHADDRERFVAAMATCRPHRIDYRVVIDGPGRPLLTLTVQQEAWLTQDDVNGEICLTGTMLDVSELKETQARVARMAYVDALTGLPNRAFLRGHLEHVLARARRQDRQFALMMIDLDMFKRINDTLGHAAGDTLLATVARRVAKAVRASDVVIRPADREVCAAVPTGENTVARLGGDEFIVVLNELTRPEDAAVVARRILESVGEPLDVGGTRIFPACSIGIAVFPENGTTADLLFKHADTALYHVKEQGRRSFHFFSEALTERADQRMRLEMGLRDALAEGRLEVHFQPKVDLRSGQVTGVEALARWPRGDGTYVPPAEFIPIAEEVGLIGELGRQVLETACAQAAAWRRTLPVALPVAVNVSGRQLGDPRFESAVAEVLARTRLPPHLLELEVTEGAMMKDIQASATILAGIRARGVRIAVDDFGTGYSSLSCLTRLPVDTLKIDRSFVRGLGSDGASGSIVIAILALSRALGLRVVAEGVETAEHAAALTRYGCEEGQGYLYARPMPAEAFERWVAGRARQSLSPRSEIPRTARLAAVSP